MPHSYAYQLELPTLQRQVSFIFKNFIYEKLSPFWLNVQFINIDT